MNIILFLDDKLGYSSFDKLPSSDVKATEKMADLVGSDRLLLRKSDYNRLFAGKSKTTLSCALSDTKDSLIHDNEIGDSSLKSYEEAKDLRIEILEDDKLKELFSCDRISEEFNPDNSDFSTSEEQPWILISGWMSDDVLKSKFEEIRGCNIPQKLMIFRWNRLYPCDSFFPFDASKLLSIGYRLSLSESFLGNSHDKIDLEVYDFGK